MRPGLSLVEVLVSIAVLAIGAVTISEALAQASYTMTVVDGYRTCHLFALSKMSELEQSVRLGEPPEDQSGSFFIGPDKFEWRATAIPLAEEPSLRTLDLTMAWRHGTRTYDRKLVTLITVPVVDDGATATE